MPKITSIEPQKKNPKRFNIFVDGIFAFGADEYMVVDFRLIPGKEIEKEMLEELLQEAEIGKLMERIYALFNIRQRSEKEIRDYLKNTSFKRRIKGKEEISNLVIDAVIQKLNKKGMLKDLAFAKAWMESRSKKYGPRRVKQELYKKGIDKEIIESVMNEKVNNGSELAENLLRKKLNFWKNLEPFKIKNKAFQFLLRRGFDYQTASSIIEKIMKKEYTTST